MNIRYRLFFSALIAATVVILITACGGKPFKYHPIHEIPQGPGLLTEKSDGAVLYDSKGGGVIKTPGDKKKDAKAGGGIEKTATKVNDAAPGGSDYEEFEEYQRWKKWREESKDSTEYQEFIEWQEWKSYQEWKRQQPKTK